MHERSIETDPSSLVTGKTQVMHTPMPHAMASSTAHWWTTDKEFVIVVMADNIGIGPQE
jgi:hypothetical protein